MKNLKINILTATIITSLFFSGCKKFLDEKPDKSRFVITKTSELVGMIDYSLNYDGFPTSSQVSVDEGYYTTAAYNSFPLLLRDTYIWKSDLDLPIPWATMYEKVFTMNVILSEAEKLTKKGEKSTDLDFVNGAALFYRALYFFEIAQQYAPHYMEGDPDSPYGIPLKLMPDTEVSTTRATLQQTFQQIIGDLERSVGLLPDMAIIKTRPSKAAAYALLAKVCLYIGRYTEAETYAEACLRIYSNLMDYNDPTVVDFASLSATFKPLNPEVITHGRTSNIERTGYFVEPDLIASYQVNDLRKTVFFRLDNGSYLFKGGYGGNGNIIFLGSSTNEVYLIRAEAKARNGNLSGALSDLNTLLIKRWKTGTFVPYTAATPDDALRLILQERRKELCYRGTMRWGDLKRLNRDPRFAITLKRKLNGIDYVLPPNDKRYTFLIPVAVMNMNPGLLQNPR